MQLATIELLLFSVTYIFDTVIVPSYSHKTKCIILCQSSNLLV